jgi:DNA-binding XRE family transcriptional regulator
MKKSREELAKELGVSVKTLWAWEVNRRRPGNLLSQRIREFLEPGTQQRCLLLKREYFRRGHHRPIVGGGKPDTAAPGQALL